MCIDNVNQIFNSSMETNEYILELMETYLSFINIDENNEEIYKNIQSLLNSDCWREPNFEFTLNKKNCADLFKCISINNNQETNINNKSSETEGESNIKNEVSDSKIDFPFQLKDIMIMQSTIIIL